MFVQSARLYDAIYSFKDYAAEAVEVRDLIRRRNADARSLLDVACGTGLHMKHLGDEFEVEGLDLDPELLEIARDRLPGVALHEGDMRDLDLGKKFDAVTCLFSAIGYVHGVDDLVRTLGRFSEHLRPGGVMVLEGWITPDVWAPRHVGATFVDRPELKIARINIAETRGRVSVMDMHYLVGTVEGVESFVEPHELYMFTTEEYIGAMGSAGLTAEHDPDALMGRGVYIGVKS